MKNNEETVSKILAWSYDFAKEDWSIGQNFYITCTKTKYSQQSQLFNLIDNELEYGRKEFHDEMFEALDACIGKNDDKTPNGIYIYHVEDCKITDTLYVPFYNMELDSDVVIYLILNQEYGLQPSEDRHKEALKKAIKAESIKKSLVYACYLNDTDLIKERLETAKPAALDKRYQCCGTPLGLCAENNNIEMFKAILAKGAKLDKLSLGRTPLALAFSHSPDVIEFIYENYNDIYTKIVLKEGATIAASCEDVKQFERLKECGVDFIKNRADFPPFHEFAKHDNIVGMQFCVDNGVNPHELVDKWKRTAMTVAKQANSKKAIAFLEKYEG